ncbi:hypothetical protein M2103_001362 [Ereboglobus sp. PH5-5]|nr:hypothetical protein [Ereboglobus sp. PH5-5]
MYSPMRFLAACVGAIGLVTPLFAQDESPSRTVAGWERWPAAGVKTLSSEAAPNESGWLELTAPRDAKRVGISVRPEAGAGSWDLEAFAEIAVPFRNLGTEPVDVELAVFDAASATGPVKIHHRHYRAPATLPVGGQVVWVTVPITGKNKSPLDGKLISLVGKPREFARHGVMDGASIARIEIHAKNARAGQRFAIGKVVARGVPEPWRDWPESRVFPLVDEFGQYAHREWPGKIKSERDFAARLNAEDADIAAHPRPAKWNRYGGWAAGPQHRATGFFRVEKIDGQWWLVDPEGRLFWSHGVVRVATLQRVGGVYRGTPLPDREHFFTLPPKDSASPLARFYGDESPSTRGYYLGKGRHAVYDFLEANLFRKHGADWEAAHKARALRRLESWGLNTIANSSDPDIYLRRKFPYTAILYSAPMGASEFRIEASGGSWGKLPDPFDPAWERHMEHTMRTELRESLNDPWCLGFFVDNELRWGNSWHAAEVTLASPASQPAKRALVSVLRKKYRDIAALNTAWATAHESWDALLAATAPPDKTHPAAKADLEMLSEHIVEKYFAGCRAAVKAASPNHLYLGARFAGSGSAFVTRVAARHCDVISINIYASSLATLPAILDTAKGMPVLIGEFHFGALDRGPFCAALVRVADQDARALAYREYVRSGLRNPAIIGTHWFQYYDQPTTGRFDGENYQTGLLDICDTPYAETIEAVRDVAATLYETRFGVRK